MIGLPEEEPKKIDVPMGFIEIEMQVTLDVPNEFFRFTPSFAMVRDMIGRGVISQPVPIGGKMVIPISPGRFNISAKLGGVESPAQIVDVRAGEVTKVLVRFGK